MRTAVSWYQPPSGESSPTMLLSFPTLASASCFDAHFGPRFALWASALALVLDEHFGHQFKLWGSLDFTLQGLQLLRTSPSGFDACFELSCALWLVPSALAGRRRHRWRAPALAAGGRQNRARTDNLQQPPCQFNESCCAFVHWYTAATVLLNFVGNRSRRCCRTLDWSAEAACLPEAGIWVNTTIISHFYIVVTSLLHVMTVMMALLLYILTTLKHHYNVSILLLLHCY